MSGEDTGPVPDLMAALKTSVDRARADRKQAKPAEMGWERDFVRPPRHARVRATPVVWVEWEAVRTVDEVAAVRRPLVDEVTRSWREATDPDAGDDAIRIYYTLLAGAGQFSGLVAGEDLEKVQRWFDQGVEAGLLEPWNT